MSVFGPIRSDDEVEDSVVATLRKWLPTYMDEVEAQRGLSLGYYKRPEDGSYAVRADFDSFPEEMLPLVVVVSPGIEEDPEKDGYGFFRMIFPIGVTCVVSSVDQVSTRRYAYRMGAAIRATLIQHQSLEAAMDDSVRGINWLGTRNDELGSESNRSIWACRQLFAVEVGEALRAGVGPLAPDTDPGDVPGDWPVIDEASVRLFNEGIQP